MKLYTRPRPLSPFQLRPGDQIATHKHNGDPLHSAIGYVDADLIEQVQWSVVHDVLERGTSETFQLDIAGGHMRVLHSYGQHDVLATADLIVRECIEIDPWTYLKHE